MGEVENLLHEWDLDINVVRENIYQATTPRERERWHAVWLLARGWTAVQVAEALERDAHTIGIWADEFDAKGPAGLSFEQSGGTPPSSTRRNKRS